MHGHTSKHQRAHSRCAKRQLETVVVLQLNTVFIQSNVVQDIKTHVQRQSDLTSKRINEEAPLVEVVRIDRVRRREVA